MENLCEPYYPKCNANCCRLFTIPEANLEYVTEDEMCFRIRYTTDFAWYLKLHGCIVNRRTLTINCSDFYIEKKEGKYFLWRDCNLLKDFKCSGYPDKRPMICKSDDLIQIKSGTITVPKGCRFNEVNDG